MSIAAIEKAIIDLDQADFIKLREWFVEYDQERWESGIKSDDESGLLDHLKNETMKELASGRTRPL